MAQEHKRATVNANGCGFDFESSRRIDFLVLVTAVFLNSKYFYRYTYIFILWILYADLKVRENRGSLNICLLHLIYLSLLHFYDINTS